MPVKRRIVDAESIKQSTQTMTIPEKFRYVRNRLAIHGRELDRMGKELADLRAYYDQALPLQPMRIIPRKQLKRPGPRLRALLKAGTVIKTINGYFHHKHMDKIAGIDADFALIEAYLEKHQ